MNHHSTAKKLFPWFWIPIIVIIVVAVAVYAFLNSPVSPTHMCTLIGCRDYLELRLSHEPPQEYVVRVTSSTGESKSITCNPGSEIATASLTPDCQAGRVIFYDFVPDEVTIKITWQSGSYSTSGHPTYTSFMPNGPDCPPVCKKATLEVNLP